MNCTQHKKVADTQTNRDGQAHVYLQILQICLTKYKTIKRHFIVNHQLFVTVHFLKKKVTLYIAIIINEVKVCHYAAEIQYFQNDVNFITGRWLLITVINRCVECIIIVSIWPSVVHCVGLRPTIEQSCSFNDCVEYFSCAMDFVKSNNQNHDNT